MAETEAAPAAPPTAEPQPTKTDLLVDKWFVDVAYNSVLSRDTQVFNRLFEAKQELKKRLNAATPQ